MQACASRDQIVTVRGLDCLSFQVVHPSLRKSNGFKSRALFSKKEHSDLVLVAITKSLPFWIQSSQTAQAHFSLRHQCNGFLRLEWLARIVAHFTITFWEPLFPPWSNSSVADTDPKLLSSPEARAAFIAQVAIRTPGVQEIIMVSRDRAALVFAGWQDRIEGKSKWHTPLALVVTLGVSLLTASFTDLPFAKAGTIKGTFITSLIVSVLWLLREGLRAIQMPSASPEQFIEELAAGSQPAELPPPVGQPAE
jgi:hypothetical protein